MTEDESEAKKPPQEDIDSDGFFEKKIYFIQKKTNRQKKYIYTLQNLSTHTINIEHIIYMQESSGHPHIDQYRSKLYSLYTSNDRLWVPTET